MRVTFISQCEKRALARTRKVLDAFAPRIGDNTWQTMITEQGLVTVKKLLRKTATRHTAVSCHWLRSHSRTQLIWIVGSRAKFNLQGEVPVNRTHLNLMHNEWERGGQYHEVIVLAGAIAGLFHDFGKANQLFQKKLTTKKKISAEPYRHEWLSLRLFQAFVADAADDRCWINSLLNIGEGNQAKLTALRIQSELFNDAESNPKFEYGNPFNQLPQFARLIAWLIVSHHRLPLDYHGDAHTQHIQYWLTRNFNCNWNSSNAFAINNLTLEQRNQNWLFNQSTPLTSLTWQKKAAELARRALGCSYLAQQNIDWLNQSFVSHMARLALMFADQYYSALPLENSKQIWRDKKYKALANTDKNKGGKPKQQLDQHSIGVSVNALRFAQNLPKLKSTLPALGPHPLLTQPSSQLQYHWQNSAFKLAQSVAKQSEIAGFFGINMASTGCGKTVANARIMYGLADQTEGARFSIALGLRTLTLQTGEAYRQLLQLQADELAVLIGSQSVQTLDELNKLQQCKEQQKNYQFSGSESEEELFDDVWLNYEGQIYDGALKRWLKGKPKLEQLLSAPLLVCTIDHLMPATESKRGGKQIVPMLRLLSADLVLDEPDDFGLDDLPALCRLVNWSGMLGGRVLISTATLPPAQAINLFDAYRAGRAQFNQAQWGEALSSPVICGWFDEFQSQLSRKPISNRQEYEIQHNQFIVERVTQLNKNNIRLRIGSIIPVMSVVDATPQAKQTDASQSTGIYQAVASTLYQHLHQLHDLHHVGLANEKKVSIGVIRMANINPLIAVAQQLLSLSPRDNYCLHFCVYHSQFPLAIRSAKENRLDTLLKRNSGTQLSEYPEIQQALAKSPANNHLFIVLGSAVVEVGRDHDYDWAIAEPSSLRALIQLAGRVQRHRQHAVTTPNLLILNKNIRGLRNDEVAFCKPGFESKALPLTTHDLTELKVMEWLNPINALSRIQSPKFKPNNEDFKCVNAFKKDYACAVDSLMIQEHRALYLALRPVEKQDANETIYRSYKEASLWWDPPSNWSAELIRQTEFRKSQPQERFYLRLPTDEALGWYQRDETRQPYCYIPQNALFNEATALLANGCFWWFAVDILQMYQELAEQLDCSVEKVSEQFGEILLSVPQHDERFYWHPQLGIHKIT